MRSRSWMVYLMATVACAGMLAAPRPLLAAEEGPGDGRERLFRLERRLNEMAERQEQVFRQLGALQERQEARLRQPAAGREGGGPLAGRDQERLRPRPQVPGPLAAPLPPRPGKGARDAAGVVALVWIIFNILLAVWIYTDIRKRNEGSGIFVALAIFAGIPAAIIYSLVRLGDKKA